MMALHSTLSPSAHEPMVIGSPPSSPQAGSNYLPGYLMGGDSNLPSSPLIQVSRSAGMVLSGTPGVGSNSPMALGGGRMLHSSFSHPQPNLNQQQAQRFLGNISSTSPIDATQRKRTPTVLSLDSRARQAPPTTSLWATPPVHPAQARLGGTSTSGQFQEATATPKGHSTPRLDTSVGGGAWRDSVPMTNLFRDISLNVPQSPAQLDPFFTQGDSLRHDDVLDERWITVFGYPSSAAAYTIEQFSHCGTIVKHVISNEGNWAHLKFQTKLQARKALSKNGKIFAESFMVGVQPCIDKRVMAADEKNEAGGESMLDKSSAWEPIPRAPGSLHPATPHAAQPQTSVLGEQSMNSSYRLNASMRSLTAGRPTGSGEATGGPRKDGANTSDESQSKEGESLISKAFSFVFGWT